MVEGRAGEEVEADADEEVEEPEVRHQGDAGAPVLDSSEDSEEEGRGPMSGGLLDLVSRDLEGLRVAAMGQDVHSHAQPPILRWCDLRGSRLETLRSTSRRFVFSSLVSQLAGFPL